MLLPLVRCSAEAQQTAVVLPPPSDFGDWEVADWDSSVADAAPSQEAVGAAEYRARRADSTAMPQIDRLESFLLQAAAGHVAYAPAYVFCYSYWLLLLPRTFAISHAGSLLSRYYASIPCSCGQLVVITHKLSPAER